MSFIINLMLLVLGTASALSAFGGETWKKNDEMLIKRITHRGWVALICMLCTLTLGIIKEIKNTKASAQSIAEQKALKKNLDESKQELIILTKQLRDTQGKLASVEPNILNAMIVATAGIRREFDFATPTLNGAHSQKVKSGKTFGELFLYGGDFIDYHIFCSGTEGRRKTINSAMPIIGLEVGQTSYDLDSEGRVMIIGPIGQPMPVAIINPERVKGCSLKILVDSADRTRQDAQLKPLIKMILDAKSNISSIK
ncbi:hypothetical protein RHD99_11090 [Buttiauxella selenatireducens]|uniref:Cell shape-determining protein MreC n=1 Tax=Buttiauxella selenatireducens TaxID=3073902 RepID=A0ABY9SFZ4_9ENTR|nr:hypothetical protein [Buttiauxella sp. R73]WMY76428.1 hypothetical protein RHD99_11090 [Buttiauxella sp. R73]